MAHTHKHRYCLIILSVVTMLAAGCTATGLNAPGSSDPLPSWHNGAAKRDILAFVKQMTTEGSQDFVAPGERIAVFDNDGTLWVEQPMYTQLAFALDRVAAMSADHPEWQNLEPFKSALNRDMQGLIAAGEHALLELIMVSHAGISTEAFADIVTAWISAARHPRFNRPYTDLAYQPMLELLDYLRANGFKTYIVSGGGVEFMRPWTESVYGIPPEQVIGSRIKTEFDIIDGRPVLLRLPEIDFVDDKAGKPVGIHKHIGRRPIAALGNSDGDLAMLQWTAAGEGPRQWLDRGGHENRLEAGICLRG